MIAVIDYGMGNLGSIINMFNRIGVDALLTSSPEDIEQADKLVLPGVGAFDTGMDNLHNLGLMSVLHRKVVEQSTPILGLCLGMQLFTEGSEEGSQPGLGWIKGLSRRFSFKDNPKLKVPHMGWNRLQVCKPHPLLDESVLDSRYYFVHSYYVECANPSDVLAITSYGFDFTSAVSRGSITGMQFHPEKSLRWGMQVFKRFANV